MTGASTGTQPISTMSLLSDALRRLRANPGLVAAFVLAGSVVAGVDYLRARSPVPATEYSKFQTSDVNLAFEILVSVLPRNALAPSALVGLKPRWLLVTVGLELFAFVTVVVTCVYALGELLDTDPSSGALARYGVLLAVIRAGVPNLTFSGGAIIIGLPLLIAALYVVVSLVALPGRLVLGESLLRALRRSWAQTAGYGWSLFGVVFVLGLATDLLAGLTLVGPIGTAAVAAVHAGVVASFIQRVDSSDGTATDAPNATPA